MVSKVPRDYDTFVRLKEEASEKITEQNAQQMLKYAKNQIMKKLQKIDIRNVTEVENLYLIVATLTQAASFKAAINKAQKKGTSFDKEIESIGLDDLSPILVNAFKDHPQVLNLDKITMIDKVYRPTKQAWAALHARMELVTQAVKIHRVIRISAEVLPLYKEHMEKKLRSNGVDIPLPKEIPAETSSMIKKMVTRYRAVLDLSERLKDKENLNPQDMEFAKDQIKKCLDNKPDWAERPFLQKLTDVLSLGIKPLYRAFSKEKGLQKTMEQSIDSPKMRR